MNYLHEGVRFMKKIIVLSLVLVLILSNLPVVSAANYLPSVDYEAYPGIVVIEDENGKKVIGYEFSSSSNL